MQRHDALNTLLGIFQQTMKTPPLDTEDAEEDDHAALMVIYSDS